MPEREKLSRRNFLKRIAATLAASGALAWVGSTLPTEAEEIVIGVDTAMLGDGKHPFGAYSRQTHEMGVDVPKLRESDEREA